MTFMKQRANVIMHLSIVQKQKSDIDIDLLYPMRPALGFYLSFSNLLFIVLNKHFKEIVTVESVVHEV